MTSTDEPGPPPPPPPREAPAGGGRPPSHGARDVPSSQSSYYPSPSYPSPQYAQPSDLGSALGETTPWGVPVPPPQPYGGPPPPGTDPSRSPRPRTLLAAVLAAAVLVGAAVTAYLVVADRSAVAVGGQDLTAWLAAGLVAVVGIGVAARLVARRADPAPNPQAATWGTGHAFDEQLLNRQSLDRYQALTQAQARSSYRVAQLAILAGMAILAVGGTVAVTAASQSAQIIVAVLSGVGTAVSGYVGATSIRMYNRALTQMNFYYAQPLVQSHILKAEMLADKLTEARRDAALERVIEQALDAASVSSRLLAHVDEEDQGGLLGRRAVARARRSTAQSPGG